MGAVYYWPSRLRSFYGLHVIMLRRIFYIFSICLFFAPGTLFAAVAPAGIADNALWFSKDPFFEGDSITIYTLLYNSSANQLSGTLTLYDGTTTLANKLFTVSGGGASSIVSFPWKVTSGTHVFSAVITSKEFTTIAFAPTGDTVATPKTGEVKRFADLDTDGDTIGNKTDPDDDNDGLSDAEEKKLGTNLLHADTDGDGLPDKSDPHPLVKEAPAKAVESKSPATEATTLPKAITDKLPEPVLKKAIPVIGAIESYRGERSAAAVKSVEKAVGEIVAGIATSSAASLASKNATGWEVFRQGVVSEEVIHSPFQYVALLFKMLWQLILGNAYVFYVLFLLIVYKIARSIWGIFF